MQDKKKSIQAVKLIDYSFVFAKGKNNARFHLKEFQWYFIKLRIRNCDILLFHG